MIAMSQVLFFLGVLLFSAPTGLGCSKRVEGLQSGLWLSQGFGFITSNGRSNDLFIKEFGDHGPAKASNMTGTWQILCESQLPERPEEPDCPDFLKTQRCKFGVRCKFNHPKDTIPPSGALEDIDSFILPERPTEPPCTFYMKTGKCKFGPTCKFHHPKGVQISSGDGIGTEVQNSIYGDATPLQTTFAPPASLHNTKGLPIRPGEEECPFFLKTGRW